MPHVRKPFVTPTSRAVTKIQSAYRGKQARTRKDGMLAVKRAAVEAARDAGLAGGEYSAHRFPEVTFGEGGSLGLALVENAAGLTQLLRANAGTQAERHAELRLGLIVLTVAGESVVGLSHATVLQRLVHSPRPLTVQFIAERIDPSLLDAEARLQLVRGQRGQPQPSPQLSFGGRGGMDESVEVRVLPDLPSHGPRRTNAPAPHVRTPGRKRRETNPALTLAAATSPPPRPQQELVAARAYVAATFTGNSAERAAASERLEVAKLAMAQFAALSTRMALPGGGDLVIETAEEQSEHQHGGGRGAYAPLDQKAGGAGASGSASRGSACGGLWWVVVVAALAGLAVCMVQMQREEASLRHETAVLQSEVEEEIGLEHALLDALGGGNATGTGGAAAEGEGASLAAGRRLSLLL